MTRTYAYAARSVLFYHTDKIFSREFFGEYTGCTDILQQNTNQSSVSLVYYLFDRAPYFFLRILGQTGQFHSQVIFYQFPDTLAKNSVIHIILGRCQIIGKVFALALAADHGCNITGAWAFMLIP